MRKLYLMFLYVCLLGLCGCGGSGEKVAEIEYVPFKENSDDLWGLISAKGEILFSNEFENMPSNVVDGLFTVEENGTYSLYKAESKPKLLRDGLMDVGEISPESKYILGVCKDSRLFLMNKKGETVRELTDLNGREIKEITKYKMGGFYIAILRESKDYKKSTVLLDDNFEIVYSSKEGVDIPLGSQNGKIMIVKDADNNKKGTIIDKEGETVFEIDKRYYPVLTISLDCMKYGMVCVKNENSYAFMTMDGEINKCPSRVNGVYDFNKKLYIYRAEGGKYGVMSMDHDIIVREKYDDIRMIDDGYFATLDDKCYVLDKRGEVVSEFTSDSYPYIVGFKVFVQKNSSRFVLLDHKGKEVTKNSYYSICDGGKCNARRGLRLDATKGRAYIKNDYTDWGSEACELFMEMKDNIGRSINENTLFNTSSYNPKNYTWKTTYSKETYKRKYSYFVEMKFDSKMAYSNNDYWNKKYYWNTKSKVKSVSYILCEDKLYSELEKLFTSVPYQSVKDTESNDETIKKYTDGTYTYTIYRQEGVDSLCHTITITKNGESDDDSVSDKKTQNNEW